MKARAILVAALAWPAGARAQAPEPVQGPPGWFCMTSATQPAIDACFRDRAACEERRTALSPTVPDVTGCAPPAPPPAPPPDKVPEPPPGETEDLLANLRPEPDVPGSSDTYGYQLRIFGVETTLGGYGDTTFTITPAEKEAQFDAHHFNPIVSARMTDTLSAEIELEIEHGGKEIGVEYAMVDWTPFRTRALVVRTGKFQIPIGKFNEQYHPSFRYPQVTRPRMFTNVVPVGWSDVGIQLRGLVGRGVAFEYQAWVVNGLARPSTEPFVTFDGEHEEEEGGGFVRGLRGGLEDNNFDKAFGARAGVNFGKKGDRIFGSIAVSGQSGKIDPAGSERLSTIDVDAHLGVGSLILNVELAQTFLGFKGDYLDRFERGAYAQLAYTAGRWTPAVRWDYATEVAVDEVDPAEDPVTSHQRVAASIGFAPARQWSVRLEALVPYRPDDSIERTSIGALLAFVF